MKPLYGILIIIVMAVIYYYYNDHIVSERQKSRLKNGSMITAYTIDYAMASKGDGLSLEATFDYKGVHYQRYIAHIQVPSFHRDRYLHKYFPLMIDTLDPTNCELFVSSATFKKYNIPVPDSLSWIKNDDF